MNLNIASDSTAKKTAEINGMNKNGSSAKSSSPLHNTYNRGLFITLHNPRQVDISLACLSSFNGAVPQRFRTILFPVLSRHLKTCALEERQQST